MSLSLNKNERFAVLRTICDGNERRSSSTRIGAYYEVFHVLEKTSCSALLFKCVLRNPLCDVRIEGARELERAFREQSVDARWFRVNRRGDGSLQLTSEHEDVVLDHSIHLPPYDLQVHAFLDVSPPFLRRRHLGLNLSANGFEEDMTPRQEQCHMNAKLPFYSKMSSPLPRQLFGKFEERILYENEDDVAIEEDCLDKENDLDARKDIHGQTDLFSLELSVISDQ